MIIKGNHLRQVRWILLLCAVMIAGDIVVCMRGNALERIFLSIVVIAIDGALIFNIGIITRHYHVDEQGISVIWFGRFKSRRDWESIRYLEKNTVQLVRLSTSYEAMICSTIPIKKRWVSEVKGNCVMANWPQEHPFRVIEIRADDMKPGQEEQFWRYVPDKLKRRSNSQINS